MHLARPRRDLSSSASSVLSVSSKIGVLILCFGVKSTLSVSGAVLVNVSESVSGKIFILEDLSFFGTLLSREWSWSLGSWIPKSSTWLKNHEFYLFSLILLSFSNDGWLKQYSPINSTRIPCPNGQVYPIIAWGVAVLLFTAVIIFQLLLLLLQMDHGHVKEAPLLWMRRTGKLQGTRLIGLPSSYKWFWNKDAKWSKGKRRLPSWLSISSCFCYNAACVVYFWIIDCSAGEWNIGRKCHSSNSALKFTTV